LPGPVDRYRRQLAPVAAFGTAVADIMLHGRADDPDPEIAARLATTTDHVLLAATRNPAPRLRSGNPAHPPTGP
jgi:hypothetical protein